MNIVHNLKVFSDDMEFSLKRKLSYHAEIKKFEDSRRKKIWQSCTLTDLQKAEIDNFYEKHYGHKIPHTWHRYYSCYTGKFDKKYFPEILYIPMFEAYMNYNTDYVKVFADKNILPLIAQTANVRMPHTFVKCVNGIYYNENGMILNNINKACDSAKDLDEVFIKPSTDSCSGKGCRVAVFSNGKDVKTQLPVINVLESLGDNFVVQERIRCHKSIAAIYPESGNTFRILTYIWQNKIETAPAIMRIGQGGNCIDNAHAGGMFVAVDSDGTLHKTAFTEFNKQFVKHPDTGLIFEGYKIDLFPNVLETAKMMHSMIPQIGVINWDFTIDHDGKPVLIEANTSGGGIWVFQMAHGIGAFGDNTANILEWIAFMNKNRKHSFYKYRYGNIINKH